MPAEPNARLTGICVDCGNAHELAVFYAGLLGWNVVATDDEHWYQLRPPEGEMTLNIQGEAWYEPPTWPEEPDRQHRMMHLEIEVTDLETIVSRAITAGATEASNQPADRDQSRIRIMLDPAGHPFCLFTPGE